MRSRSIQIYAAGDDVPLVLAAVDPNHELKFVECGLFDNVPPVKRWDQLPALGRAESGQAIQGATYLVFRGHNPNARRIPQRKGGVKFAIDQIENPGSIVLRPGGTFEGVVIAGMMGTVHSDTESLALFDSFAQALRNRFKRIKSFLVGPEAVTFLERGARLTTSTTASAEYDLRVS